MNDYLIIIRNAGLIYLLMLVAIRFLGKREFSQLSIKDLVFVLLISNTVQNAMVDPDPFQFKAGLVAAGCLFVLNYLLNIIGYKFAWFEKLLSGEPVLLIYKGKINEVNLRREQISINDLLESIREHGSHSIKDVDLAILETDGNISILSNDYKQKSYHPGKHRKKVVTQS